MHTLYKVLFILIIFTLFVSRFIGQTYANILFYDPIYGNIGTNWVPSGWTQVQGQGVYVQDGVVGLTDIFKDFGVRDLTIKFDYNIHSKDTTVFFACRANSTYSDVIQPFLEPDGTSHIDECNNGNCYRDLPSSGKTDVPYDQSIGTHHIEFSCQNNSIVEKEDGNIIIATTSNAPLSTGVRFYISSGTNSVSNLQICDSVGCSSPISLNVPDVKQTSSPWNTDMYDSATTWAPQDPTINDWGCALTSAAMVLQYNGITTMPHDPAHTPLDPRSLNNWLQSQPDGYAYDALGHKTGNVNWLAITRLTRLAGLNQSDNPNFHYHALMYKPLTTTNKSVLTYDLSNNIPDILEEPGHFVVATGTQGTSYTINDPYYNNRQTLNDGYNNTFLSLGRYIPSLTDLSYIFLVAPTNVTVTIRDSQNNEIGDSFVQQPLTNDANPTQTSGNPIQEIYAATPSAGLYHIDVSGSSPTNYNLEAYLYDINGNVQVASFSGTVSPTLPSDLFIDFNKQQVTDSSIKTISIDTTIQDIKYYTSVNQIAYGPAEALIALLQNAKKDQQNEKQYNAKLDLKVVEIILKLLNVFRGKGISENAYQILLLDINYLKSHL